MASDEQFTGHLIVVVNFIQADNKENIKVLICAGKLPVTGRFPTQMASIGES